MAEACGADVEVVSERTPWQTSWASSRGTARLDVASMPQRVQVDGEWVALDTTLVEKSATGGLEVAAPVFPMELNAGGLVGRGKPLGSIERGGKAMDVWFPLELPTPQLSDSQAVYDFGDGIRLLVSVNVDATGFLPVVELADAEAAAQFEKMLDAARAANGALSEGMELEFATAVSDGLALVVDDENAVHVIDESGETHFMAAPPIMWDSSGEELDIRSSATEVGVIDRTRSPAEGDEIAAMGVELSGDTIVVKPDAGMLESDETVWPVYVDPSFSAKGAAEWVAVRTGGYTGTLYKWGDISSSMPGQGTGYCSQVASCNVVFKQRLVWEFTGLYGIRDMAGSDIISAGFSVWGAHSYNCTARKTTLYRTSSISTGSKWSNVSWHTASGSRTEAHSATCRNRSYKLYNALSAMKWAADNNQSTLTLGLAVDESSMAYWKRFRHDATLQAEWNRAPNVPTGHQLSNESGCTTGEGRPVIADTTPNVSVTSSDPDGQNIHTSFVVASASNTADVKWSSGNLTKQGNNTRVTKTVGSGLISGGVYAWRARAYDGARYSSWSAWCEFAVDTSSPPGPTVTPVTSGVQAIYEENVERGGVSQQGAFVINPGSATDVVEFEYGFNDPAMAELPVTPGPDGTAVITFSPNATGEVNLFVRSRDAAENFSPTTRYTFHVATATEDAIWMLDEGEGSTATDSVGAGNRPLDIDGASWVDGPHALFDSRPGDRALRFDGVNDAAEASGPVLETTKSFAVSAHVWLDGDAQGSSFTALSQDGVTSSGFRVEYLASCPGMPGGCWAFAMPDAITDSEATTVYSPIAPTRDEWTHLVAEHDVGDDTLRLWVCEIGTPDAPKRGNPMMSAESRSGQPWSASGSFTLGRGLSAGHPTSWWQGSIDNVRVFSGEVLAEEKIRRLCQGAEATDFGGDVALDPTTEAEQ